MSELQNLSADGLQVVPTIHGNAVRIKMTGAVEMRDPGEVLTPFWNVVDDEARRLAAKRVEVDMRDLSFMNSSGILTLVRWITKAKSHAPGAGYEIALEYDRNVTWQRTSIPTLAKLAPTLVIPTDINA